jgi:hypothetical protein
MSDMMIPYLPRPSTVRLQQKPSGRVEKQLEVRKTIEDEADLTEEKFHPAYAARKQKHISKHNSSGQNGQNNDDDTEHLDIFV